MLTTYFFNYFLIPKFLFSQRYKKFFLYSSYTVVFSAYLETIVLLLVFVFVAELNVDAGDFDSVFLLAGMYLPVLLGVAIKLFKTWQEEQTVREEIEREKTKMLDRLNPETETISLRADRKTYKLPPAEILYVEGLKDYVKVHTINNKPLIVKETLSGMERLLSPFDFQRIHKSFIVSKRKINSFNNNEVQIGTVSLPVGRSYKKEFVANFSS